MSPNKQDHLSIVILSRRQEWNENTPAFVHISSYESQCRLEIVWTNSLLQISSFLPATVTDIPCYLKCKQTFKVYENFVRSIVIKYIWYTTYTVRIWYMVRSNRWCMAAVTINMVSYIFTLTNYAGVTHSGYMCGRNLQAAVTEALLLYTSTF